MTRDAAFFHLWVADTLRDLRDEYFAYHEARENCERRFPEDSELLGMAREAEDQARRELDRFERMPLEARVGEFARAFSRGPRGPR